MEEKHCPKGLVCPITHEALVVPVILPCGHTFEKWALEAWRRNSDGSPTKICPLRCKFTRRMTEAVLDDSFVPAKNFALMELQGEDSGSLVSINAEENVEVEQTFWLTSCSQIHLKSPYKKAVLDFCVHRLRMHVLEMAGQEKITFFGGSVLRMIKSSNFVHSFKKHTALKEGTKIPVEAIIPGDIDLDLFFSSADQLTGFRTKLQSIFHLRKKARLSYRRQNLMVESYRLVPILNLISNGNVSLCVDLVRKMTRAELLATDERCLGITWPDVDWNQLASRNTSEGKQIVFNPLVDMNQFFDAWIPPGSYQLETRESIFVRDLVKRVENQTPARWCLVDPYSLSILCRRAESGEEERERMDESEAWDLYLSNMIIRAQRFIMNHTNIDGLHIEYKKDNEKPFGMGCGHWFVTLANICRFQSNAIYAICPEGCGPLRIFEQFLPIAS